MFMIKLSSCFVEMQYRGLTLTRLTMLTFSCSTNAYHSTAFWFCFSVSWFPPIHPAPAAAAEKQRRCVQLSRLLRNVYAPVALLSQHSFDPPLPSQNVFFRYFFPRLSFCTSPQCHQQPSGHSRSASLCFLFLACAASISAQTCPGRPLDAVIVQPTAPHTATMIFLHGLGDSGHGWSQAEWNLPFAKLIFPNAPSRPITVNGGARMPGWCNLH